MSTHSSPISKPRSVAAICTAICEWALTDGLIWAYIFKALTACFLALGVALVLDLPQPRTAMTTVFIVMQPQGGMVLAKSFYRICGNLVGLVVMLVLVALLSQQPEMFIVATAIWLGICTMGAARRRNFKSYGFVIAGSTAALVGIPVAQHPDIAFIGALTRVAEVLLGIVSSALVSALLFPRHANDQLPITLRVRFAAFAEHVSVALSVGVDRKQVDITYAGLVADIVGFEAMCSAAAFESPDARMRRGKLARLNNEFMTLSTRFYTLYHLANRLRDAGTLASTIAMDRLQPYLLEIGPLLVKAGGHIEYPSNVIQVCERLKAYEAQLQKRLGETRGSIDTLKDDGLLDFDTGAEMLCRFVRDLYAYTATYASLSSGTRQLEQWIERYEPKTNTIAVSVSGLRTVILTIMLGAFWIETAWPSGLTMTVGVSTVTALISSSPDPKRTAFQMAIGAVLSSVTGMVVLFGVYPYIDGFPLLCAALTPFILLGVLMTIRPKLAGCGSGYCIFFCYLAGPDNVIHYDPSSFMNDALALILSMLVTAVAFAVLLPPSTPWIRKRLLIDLRRQIMLARRGGMQRVRSQFESGSRDLAFQIGALPPSKPELKLDAVRWLLLVLEIGSAVIDLRKDAAELRAEELYGKSMSWQASVRVALNALSTLFDVPRTDNFDHAVKATVDAVATMQEMLSLRVVPDPGRRRLEGVLNQLHFIRTVLLDPQSPFGSFISGSV
jgi:uncharacterized membrane protein YccC